MKQINLCLAAILLTTTASFAQVAAKREMEKKKPDTTQKATTVSTVLTQSNVTKTSPVDNKPQTATLTVHQNASTLETKKEGITVVKETKVPQNNSTAALLDAFFTVETGISAGSFPISTGYNKDADTHWSCGIFDQNDRPISSFHDDSNTDEYHEGSVTGPLKMHIDNAAIIRDFANGRLHINIAPNGNDTWVITHFALTLDFQNPNFSQKLTWDNIDLSQDKRDVDLYFIYDGKNLDFRH